MEQGLSVEERLAQAMIDLRKGHTSETNNLTIARRDYLRWTIKNIKKDIDRLKKENDVLNGLRKKSESILIQINPISEIDAHLVPDDYDRCHGTRDTSIQTEPITSIPLKDAKTAIIENLSIREKMLQEKLRRAKIELKRVEPASTRIDSILLKKNEYDKLKEQAQSFESKLNESHSSYQQTYLPLNRPIQTITTPTGNPSDNGVFRSTEESDDEGVQLLLSMKGTVFKCKCGEYANSITDWSEHQRTCTKSEKREQCKLCNKTFLTCVALNIHSTKKHNKKKIRTDSVMHCPCGQSFTAKWRQNCVHKLNSHGRHCKAFKERETQCSICKKGFIDRKSLEYHGLKAHKLAVPINS